MKHTSLLCAAMVGTTLLVGASHASSASLISSAALTGAADALSVDTWVARVARGGRAAVGPRGGVAVRRGGVAVGPRGGVAYRRSAVAGPRGNVAVRRGAVVGGRGAVVAPGVRYGRWVRPGNYWWPVGGAIAAGAAIGMVTAATAAAWAGPAPGPNMCWYYTDPSRRQGFWDTCQ
jgi:hypothetical protein